MGRTQDLRFTRLSLQEGLSQSSVRQIIQDRQGFIWVTTEEGLNRYDGYQFLNFNYDKNDTTSIGDQYTNALWEDPSGCIWVGTNSSGINKMDVEQEVFVRYKHVPGDSTTLSDNNVYVFHGLSSGIIWVGTVKGLDKFNILTGKVEKQYKHDPKDKSSLVDDMVHGILKDSKGDLWVGTENGLSRKRMGEESFSNYFCKGKGSISTALSYRVAGIYEDRSGNIWAGTDHGLYLYNEAKDDFISVDHAAAESNDPDAKVVQAILEDHAGTLWVGTRAGLYRSKQIDTENNVFQFNVYKSDPQNENSISDNVIYTLFEDDSNMLWVGTSIGGVCKLDLAGSQFQHYKETPESIAGLNDPSAWSFYKWDNGELWVGTGGGGITRFDKNMENVSHWLPDPKNKEASVSGNRIWDMAEDKNGNLWIAVFAGGLNMYDPVSNTFTHYVHDPQDSTSIANNLAIDVLIDDDSGAIFVATWGMGLDILNSETGVFEHIREIPGFVTSITKTSDDQFWVGTMDKGLFSYNRATGKVYHFMPSEEHNSLSNSTVWGVYSRHPDTLWVATAWGVDEVLLTGKEPVFRNYNEEHGLAKNTVYSVIGDDLGYLWMITTYGLSRFNPSDQSFLNFYLEDGIQSNEFNHGAVYKSKDGMLYFGGINGFNIIDPAEIKSNNKVPPVYVTDLKLFNKSVPIGKQKGADGFYLNKNISRVHEITLAYDQAFFSFDYAALNYKQPEQNEYAYYLEGLEDDWNYVKNRRTAYYTSVPHGEYVFHVKGSNNDGVWNEKGASIRIVIIPPWWLTPWAKVLWAGIAMGLLWTIYKVRVNNLSSQKETLEHEVASRTREIMKQKEEMESQAENLIKMNLEIQERNSEVLSQSEFIQEVNDELKDKNEALEKAYQNVALLSTIGQHITAQLSMGEMIREVYHNVQSLMRVDEFGVGRYDESLGEIIFEAIFSGYQSKSHRPISVTEKHRLSVQCVLNKQEIFMRDVQKEYLEYAKSGNTGYHEELLSALIVLPLVSGEQVTGLIWVQSKEKNVYSTHELDLLKNLASYVSIALDNAGAYRKINNQRKDLEKAQKLIRKQNESLSNTNEILEEMVEQRTRELNHLTYRSAHDLKGPITRLLGLCYACRLDIKESLEREGSRFRPKLEEYLGKMENTASDMQKMLSRLLRIHDIKMRMPTIQEASVMATIESSWKSVSDRINTSEIDFQIFGGEMDNVETDPKLLLLLLENLYENAVLYADPKEKEQYIRTKIFRQQSELILEISDNGVGVNEMLTDDIFKMFVKGTTESKGVGLGLYESKIIIDKLKGSLQLDLTNHDVTTFRVWLP
ncbi:two-component regulator propeller domain-containing protein [Fulvivirga marina]|uniref:two-component regulator propeller domain-containing protein n=1 Tax=Fulvivirga marina TaxID=2494733 RepID=UPI00192DECF3|nr:two-component regulator propeller domain-containing protein [Fulvivirga marina]